MSGKRGVALEHIDGFIRQEGINHLLVIAIDEYVHAPKLHNCVLDAEAFIKVLTHKYRFNPENVHTIYNQDASRENILETLHRYRMGIQEMQKLQKISRLFKFSR